MPWRRLSGACPVRLKELWDVPYAPPLVIIPAGRSTIGGNAYAENAGELYRKNTALPRHRVRIGYPLAVGKYSVTRAEFAAFVAEARVSTAGARRVTFLGAGPGGTWENPGFPQTDNDPAACISYDVAMALCRLAQPEDRPHLWSAVGIRMGICRSAGTTTAFYWGDDVGVEQRQLSPLRQSMGLEEHLASRQLRAQSLRPV